MVLLVLAGKQFRRQADLIRSIRELIGSQLGGQWDTARIGTIQEPHAGWVAALMKRHPWCHEWLGDWSDTLSVVAQQQPVYSQCLAANLITGGYQSFSYHKCIHADRNRASSLRVHMREIIQPQIQSWMRKQQLDKKCVYCLNTNARMEVDHVTPFVNICTEWLNGQTHSPYTSNRSVWQSSWMQFHQSRAVLRWLCMRCNRRKGTRMQKRKPSLHLQPNKEQEKSKTHTMPQQPPKYYHL